MKISVNDKNSIIKNTWLFPVQTENGTVDVGEDIHVFDAIMNYASFLKIPLNEDLEGLFAKNFNLTEDVAKIVTNKIINSLVDGMYNCLMLIDENERELIIKAYEHLLIANKYDEGKLHLFLSKYAKNDDYFKDFNGFMKLYNFDSPMYKLINMISTSNPDKMGYQKGLNQVATLFLKKCVNEKIAFKDVCVPDLDDMYCYDHSKSMKADIVAGYMEMRELDELILGEENAENRLNFFKNFNKETFKQLYDAIMTGNKNVMGLSLDVYALDLIVLLGEEEDDKKNEMIKNLIDKLYSSESYFYGQEIVQKMLLLLYVGNYEAYNHIPKYSNGLSGSYIKEYEENGIHHLEVNKHKILLMQGLSNRIVSKEKGGATMSAMKMLEGIDVVSPLKTFFYNKQTLFRYECDKKSGFLTNEKNTRERSYQKSLIKGLVLESDLLLEIANENGLDLEIYHSLNSVRFSSKEKIALGFVKEAVHMIITDYLAIFDSSKNEKEKSQAEFRDVLEPVVLKYSMKKDIFKKPHENTIKSAKKF